MSVNAKASSNEEATAIALKSTQPAGINITADSNTVPGEPVSAGPGVVPESSSDTANATASASSSPFRMAAALGPTSLNASATAPESSTASAPSEASKTAERINEGSCATTHPDGLEAGAARMGAPAALQGRSATEQTPLLGTEDVAARTAQVTDPAGVAAPAGTAESESKVFRVEFPLNSNAIISKATAAITAVQCKLLATKATCEKSPWILSVVVSIIAVHLAFDGLFAAIGFLFRIRIIKAMMKVYQIFFSVTVLVTEMVRYYPILKSRHYLRKWAPCLENLIGRGVLQILTGGLALTPSFNWIRGLPGLTLVAAGLLNVVLGVHALVKLHRLFQRIQRSAAEIASPESMRRPSGSSSLSVEQRFNLVRRKFRAMDINNDGRLSRDELIAACQDLNLPLKLHEAEHMFDVLDSEGKGYIELDALETWWFAHHKLESLFLDATATTSATNDSWAANVSKTLFVPSDNFPTPTAAYALQPVEAPLMTSLSATPVPPNDGATRSLDTKATLISVAPTTTPVQGDAGSTAIQVDEPTANLVRPVPATAAQ